MPADLVGQQIEHYRIEGVLGHGGMGTVYQAVDINLARPVAIKVMHDQYAGKPEFQQRFQQEAQAAAKLEHPAIVRVYHFGRERGFIYIVMELVPGLSLGSYLKQLALHNQIIRLDETLLLMAQVADALGYAHRKGIIHRDVKPDNIIVKQVDQEERPGAPPLQAMVTDFGLVKLMEGGVDTRTGELLGTLAYVSPEQVMDLTLDGRSDLYSLGVVLFQLATGRLPFDVRTPSDAVRKHLHEPPPLPHEVQPGLPIALGQVIWKTLAKQPEDRYQSGEELAEALREVARNLSAEEEASLSPALQSSVTSMVIELDSDPNLANTSRWLGEQEVRPPGYDRLLISRENEEAEIYSLYKRRFTIGRSAGNDIVLVGSNVSRWHARLDYVDGAWQITDMGSTNGTFLNKSKLAPNQPQAWSAGQDIDIGPFQLRLQHVAGENEPPAVEPGPPPRPQPSPAPRPVERAAPVYAAPPPPREHIVADMRPQRLKQSGICRVLVLNQGQERARVTLAGSDPYNNLRFDAPVKQVTISAGQKGMVDFYVEAQKRSLFGRRQSYPFTIEVDTSRQEWGSLAGELQVSPTISVWLVLGLLLLLLLLMLLVVAFVGGYLPWTPESILSDLLG